MQGLKKRNLLFSIIVIVTVMGCGPQEFSDALKPYTVRCYDAGTSNSSMNTKVVNQSFNMNVSFVDTATGQLASIPSNALSYIGSLNLEFTAASDQSACEAGSARISSLSQVNQSGVVNEVLGLQNSVSHTQTLNNLRVSQPHQSLYCRVNIFDTDGNIYRKCSLNNARFAVRPANFVLEAVEPANPRKSGGNLLVAAGEGGSSADAKARLTLRARAVGLGNTATLTGFTGASATMDLTTTTGLARLVALNKVGTDAQATNLSVKGILSPASFAFSSGQATATVSYSEVGFINLDAGALVESGFAKADADAGRCDPNSMSNTPNVQGRVGCMIGSTIAQLPVKFVPFRLSASSPTTKTVDNPTNTCNRFAYYGGDLTTGFRLTALNSAGNVTRNYSNASGLAMFDATNYANYNVASTTALNASNQNVAINFDKSDVNNAISATSWVNGSSDVSIKLKSNRPVSPIVPTQLTIRATPTDAEINTTGLTPDAISIPIEFRYGRVKLNNAYGSETMALNYEVDAQYFKNNTWTLNADDGCSTISADMFKVETPTDTHKNKLSQCGSTMKVINSGLFNGGHAQLSMTAPGNGNNGWFYISMKQDGLNRDDDIACVTGQGRIKAKSVNVTPQFGLFNTAKAMVSFGQYKSKMIYSGEQ